MSSQTSEDRTPAVAMMRDLSGVTLEPEKRGFHSDALEGEWGPE